MPGNPCRLDVVPEGDCAVDDGGAGGAGGGGLVDTALQLLGPGMVPAGLQRQLIGLLPEIAGVEHHEVGWGCV